MRGRHIRPFVVRFALFVFYVLPISSALAQDDSSIEPDGQMGDDSLSAGGAGLGSAYLGTTAADVPQESERDIQSLSAPSGDVSSSGAFLYSLPISLPPGIAGFSPTVKLTYSSANQQNGALGVGWSLMARSCIQRRGPKFVDSNNNELYGAGVPTFGNSDSFFLDESPLLLCDTITDQSLVGGPNSPCPRGTYRSQRNDFSKVEMQPASLPTGWIVRLSNGDVLEYNDLKFDAGKSHTFDNASEFCLSKRIRGRNSIVYKSDPTSGFPTEITYGVAGSEWHIRFNYEPRPDTEIRFTGGRLQTFNVRLKSIVEYLISPSQLLRSFEIGYEQSPTTGASRLVSVTETGTTHSDALPPYRFSYDDTGVSGFTAQATPTPTPIPGGGDPIDARAFGLDDSNLLVENGFYYRQQPYAADIDIHEKAHGLQFADLNRDGYPDLIRHDDQLTDVWMNNPIPNTKFRQFVESPAGKNQLSAANIPNFTFQYNSVTVSNGTMLIDINGDGYPDLIQGNAPDKSFGLSSWWVGIFDPVMNSTSICGAIACMACKIVSPSRPGRL